jgi:pantoate--beta-alanine ligase
VALRLNAALLAMQAAFARGERSAAALEASGRALLGDDGRLAPDYLAVVEPDGLTPTPEVEPGHFAIVAARIGRTRLIDNMRVGGAGGAA